MALVAAPAAALSRVFAGRGACSAAASRRRRDLSLAVASPATAAEKGMVVVGHRGMGMNAVGSPPEGRLAGVKERENTLLSFGCAAANPAVDFVEFDVQVTKDGYPIIFHDDVIHTQEDGNTTERRVTDLFLAEFLSYGQQKESGKVRKPLLRRTEDGRVLKWIVEHDDHLCTLQEAFRSVKPSLGFIIELKFADNIVYQGEDLDRTLQAVLQVVTQNAKNRPIFFSSFQPDAAQMMRKLQSLYPVLFLTEAGIRKHSDPRRNSLDEALKVCQEYGLQGVVSEVRGVLKNPSAVVRTQESNLALLTYGQLNNVREAVYIQYLMGVNGVIVDLVEEISKAVMHFGKSEPDKISSMSGGNVDEVNYQPFSQQQLAFLLRLIPELIQHQH